MNKTRLVLTMICSVTSVIQFVPLLTIINHVQSIIFKFKITLHCFGISIPSSLYVWCFKGHITTKIPQCKNIYKNIQEHEKCLNFLSSLFAWECKFPGNSQTYSNNTIIQQSLSYELFVCVPWAHRNVFYTN